MGHVRRRQCHRTAPVSLTGNQPKERNRPVTLTDLAPGDVLVSVDANGAGYYRVEKVCRRMVKVVTEQGHTIRAYPSMFDRKLSPERLAAVRAEGIPI